MKTEIKFIAKIESQEWSHFLWSVRIGEEIFNYKTGLGHATLKRKKHNEGWNARPKGKKCVDTIDYWAHVPEIDTVLWCLFTDAQCGQESFKDFCDNCGYSNDSINAMKVYLACGETAQKLRRALGKDYQKEKERIEALEL